MGDIGSAIGCEGKGTTMAKGDEAGKPASVLELQRMVLDRALANLDLDAAQSCTSCNSNSCNFRPPVVQEA